MFNVIIIGGGHAGAEAAWACANVLSGIVRGANEPPRIALITQDPAKIGVMSCNPAIGGLAKGQLVREIDALHGLMGLAADASGIQFKVLNQSKGPAVHGPRAQCDKHAYARAVQALLASRPDIEVIAGSVERLIVEKGKAAGVEVRHARASADVLTLLAPAVVLTTGTFMRGLMHCGEQQTPGGRFGEAPATGISAALKELGFELGRLKTGTPPRLRKGSIRWDDLVPARGDEHPLPFSDLSGLGEEVAKWQGSEVAMWQSDEVAKCADHESLCHFATPSLRHFPVLPQVECRQTRTTPEAHSLIRENLHRAPMYSGQIESAGPRYCPSIEDKVVRFAERDSHGVFLEPESLSDDWVYCNGISTSLPPDVQDRIVRAMPGCQRAEILRYGYAVEYDMVRPHQITAGCMTKSVAGLFLAGQINGTSGYEEAAAQGLVAGLNAARFALNLPEIVFGRDEAYVGVLMDDLVTKTPVEPYRMFTSRAEHRLSLRSDNAPERLTPKATALGLLNNPPGLIRQRMFEERNCIAGRLESAVAKASPRGEGLARLLRSEKYSVEEFRAALNDRNAMPTEQSPILQGALRRVHADFRYAAYLLREQSTLRKQSELERKPLPVAIDYAALHHLRAEARQALHRYRPATFGQAGRLEGITPADMTLLSVLVDRWQRASAR